MPKASTKRDVENDMKTEPSSAPMSEQDEQSEGPLPGKQLKPLRVEFKLPSSILNISGTLQQIGRNQAVIVPKPAGVWFLSFDPRVKQVTFMPWGAIKEITYETE